MKKARMNVSRFILSKLKIFGEIVTTLSFTQMIYQKLQNYRSSYLQITQT